MNLVATPSFDSGKFINFCIQNKNNLNFFQARSDKKINQTSFAGEKTNKHIDQLHKRFTNNGKGLLRFVTHGGEIVTQDERLRLAVYQSTFKDSDFV